MGQEYKSPVGTFGQALERWRNAAKLSQTQLGEALDVSQQTISSWELGTAMPSMAHVVELGRRLNVSAQEMGAAILGELAVTDALAGIDLDLLDRRLRRVEKLLETGLPPGEGEPPPRHEPSSTDQ